MKILGIREDGALAIDLENDNRLGFVYFPKTDTRHHLDDIAIILGSGGWKVLRENIEIDFDKAINAKIVEQ